MLNMVGKMCRIEHQNVVAIARRAKLAFRLRKKTNRPECLGQAWPYTDESARMSHHATEESS